MAREHPGDRQLLRRIARGVALLVYRDIDIHLPAQPVPTGPVLAVSNHFGGLADGVLLIDAAPRAPRVIARDLIWKVPLVGRLATAAGMIPVHRAADGAGVSNAEAFGAAHSALAAGDLVLIFPEGVTQDVPHMAKVRTGAARIALGARDTGVAGISVLPIGLHYEDKAGFRSRALVNVGDPIDLDSWAAAQSGPVTAEDRDAVVALNAVIDSGLRWAAPDFPDWDTAHALETVAEVVLHDVDAEDAELQYGDLALVSGRLDRLPEPQRSDLVERGAHYRASLAAARTTDRAVINAGTSPARWWRWLLEVALMVLLLPYALIGLAIALLPLLIVSIASRLRIAPAERATFVPALAFLTFLIEWGLFVGQTLGSDGVRFGAFAVVLFPFAVGTLFYVAERIPLLWRRFRDRRRPSGLDALRAERRELADRAWAAL